jgi:hypothetical protein
MPLEIGHTSCFSLRLGLIFVLGIGFPNAKVSS